jgi:uncharacterized protein YfaS (alpha-2-macroglobulin family)
MRRIGLLLAIVLALAAGVARAEFSLPGLETDAQTYESSLTARFPAGATAQARKQSEQAAADATRKRDWAAAAAALETRIGQGDADGGQWLSLAQAQMRRTPPNLQRALQAAWQAFSAADTGPDQNPALLLMADVLRALDRPAQAIAALEAAQERAPADARIRQALDDARRATGVLVARITPEPEADPPRACIAFSVAPSRRDDFHPQDWVRLDPPVPGAAVTREGDAICVSGLPSGATTHVVLRAGMPGEGGLSLIKEANVAVALANRAPRVVFDSRLFILPRGQSPTLTMTTINLSAVKLTLSRLTERNVLPFVRDNRLGEPISGYAADEVGEQRGRVVWEGNADVPDWQPNRPARVALPLPDALATAGPGLYALTARPGDGTPQSRYGGPAAVQMILRTDLAPTVWRGSDGLTVQVRGYGDARPRADVALDLLAENNDILASAKTDTDGVARFAAPLLAGTGTLAPRTIHLLGPDQDFAALDLDRAAFDLSDRGVSGAPHPGPLDAFIWLDRGIYRPGETVHVMALLRDAAGAPADIPAHVIVRRPNGQVFSDTTPPRAADDALTVPVALSRGAAAGTWTVEVRADPDRPPIGHAEFRVDAFVPDRMAVDLGPAAGPIEVARPFAVPVVARFLYGAPGAGLSGKGSFTLTVDPAPFPSLAGYRIGLEGEAFAPDTQNFDLADTDADGKTTLPVLLRRAPDTTHALKADLVAEINDPSGHGSKAALSVPVKPAGLLIGIKPLFAGDAVDAQTEAAFDIAAANPDGSPAGAKLRLRLVRERPDWHMVVKGGLARYETVWRDEPLETRDVTLTAGTPLRFAKTLGFGRYRLEATETGGLAATSVRFRSGWASADNPDVPDQVDVSVDRGSHPVGAVARVHIAAPFAGPATLLVLSDRVHSLRDIDVPAGGTDVDVQVGADWGPGAYVAVHVFRPGEARNRPGRAIGLAWVGVDPAARKLDVAVETPDKLPPRARAVVPVRAAPGAWVTLAAVDEGILRLTNFPTPDPAAHFLGRRRLGLDIRDDWGRLIAPGEGAATLLRQGGDEGSFALPDIPQRTVTLFSPPVQAGADGRAMVPLDLPDFAGQVRLMAVAWSGDRVGAAASDVLVRDPLVAEPLLPRFLAPGDEARVSVLLHNLELPAGEAAATVSVTGPLTLAGPPRLAATLTTGAQAVPSTVVRATGAGRGVIALDVAGPGGFAVHRETAITVRPSRGAVTSVAATELAPGAQDTLTPPIAQFVAGTWRASASFGGAVRYDPAAMVRALSLYPLDCLEQATSRGFPLATLPDGPVAGDERRARLQAAIASVLDRQRFDGGFALWSAAGEAEPWLSAYATEFLLRAQAAGEPVPAQALKDALHFISDATDSTEPGRPEEYAAQAYRLYVLARAGQGRPGAARVMAERIDQVPTPLARAQLAAALALAHDRPRAEAAFTEALASVDRKPWSADYGSALRDQAAIAVLLRESGLLSDRLARLIAQLPGADTTPDRLNTQEQAWTATAAAVLGRDGRPARVALDGRPLDPAPVVAVALTGAASARNLDDRPVWQTVSLTGVPATALPAAAQGMRITRRFLNLDGSPLDLDHLKQNTVFVLLLEGSATDGQDHRAMVMHGLPAGWEIAGRLSGGEQAGAAWLGTLSETEAQPAADDRYAAVIALTPEQRAFRVAVRLRAVTPGSYDLPGAELSDMYRPGVFARQNGGRITVLPLE